MPSPRAAPAQVGPLAFRPSIDQGSALIMLSLLSALSWGPPAVSSCGVIRVKLSLRHGETIVKADPLAQRGRREAAQPDRRMRPLERLRCYLDVSEVEELALEGDGRTRKGAANRERIPVVDEGVLRRPMSSNPLFSPHGSDRGFRGRAGRRAGAAVADFGSRARDQKRIFTCRDS